jgi:hypothetical protein
MVSFHGVDSNEVDSASTIKLEHGTTTMTKKNTVVESRDIRKEGVGGNSFVNK